MVYGDWKLHEVIARARLSAVPSEFPAKTITHSSEYTTTCFACHTGVNMLETTKAVAKLAVRGSLAVFASEQAHVHRCDAERHSA